MARKKYINKNKHSRKILGKKIFSRYDILYKILKYQANNIDTKDLEYILYEIEKRDNHTRRYTRQIELDSPLVKKYFHKEEHIVS